VNLRLEKNWLVIPSKVLFDDGSSWSFRDEWLGKDEQERVSLLKGCLGVSGKCGPKSKPGCKDGVQLTGIPEQLVR